MIYSPLLISFTFILIIWATIFFVVIFRQDERQQLRLLLVSVPVLFLSIFYRLKLIETGNLELSYRIIIGLTGFIIPSIVIVGKSIYNTIYYNLSEIKSKKKAVMFFVIILITHQVFFLQLNNPVNHQDGLTFIEPILEYGHEGGLRSVTGGYVYRGDDLPQLNGTYLFADFITGLIYSYNLENNNLTNLHIDIDSNKSFHPSSFGVDEDNEIYLTNRANGGIYKLTLSSSGESIFKPYLPHLRFSKPIGLFNANDGSGRLFVIEQEGSVKQIQNNQSSVFLNISNKVAMNFWEQGLLGFAFHPDYKINSFIYATYTTESNSIKLVKFIDKGSPSETAKTESMVLEVSKQNFHHNGGHIMFDEKGLLFLGIGDDAFPGDALGNSQNLETLKGVILRLDIDNVSKYGNYSIPEDNPFYGNKEGYKEEIWAYGLRNPWKYSIDWETNTMYLGDVGENDWEEINIIVQGGNYGWAFFEGTHCYYFSNDYRASLDVYSGHHCIFLEDLGSQLIFYNIILKIYIPN